VEGGEGRRREVDWGGGKGRESREWVSDRGGGGGRGVGVWDEGESSKPDGGGGEE